jgi:hypothetical protein
MKEDANDPAITLLGTNRAVIERALNQAVNLMRAKALSEGFRGTLATQEAPGRFTIALNDALPFGHNREKPAG